MNIVLILPNLNGGGAERVSLTVLRQMRNSGHHLTLVVFSKTNDLLGAVPDEIKIINLNSKKTMLSIWSLIKAIYRLKPDIVFTTHSRVAAIVGLLRPLCPSFKHIARMQNMPSLESKYSSYGAIKRLIYAWGFRRADVVLAQTLEMEKDAIDIFGVQSENVSVFHNPVDVDFINDCLSLAVSPFSGKGKHIVASGRLHYQKGFDVLLHSMRLVVDNDPDITLHILGSDVGEGEALRRIVKDLSLDSNVIFEGYQKNPYVYYKFCDAFVLSSRYEGFPNVLLENLYLNTPVVATDCIDIVSNLIVNGSNGYVVSAENHKELAASILACLGGVRRDRISNPLYAVERFERYL